MKDTRRRTTGKLQKLWSKIRFLALSGAAALCAFFYTPTQLMDLPVLPWLLAYGLLAWFGTLILHLAFWRCPSCHYWLGLSRTEKCRDCGADLTADIDPWERRTEKEDLPRLRKRVYYLSWTGFGLVVFVAMLLYSDSVAHSPWVKVIQPVLWAVAGSGVCLEFLSLYFRFRDLRCPNCGEYLGREIGDCCPSCGMKVE